MKKISSLTVRGGLVFHLREARTGSTNGLSVFASSAIYPGRRERSLSPAMILRCTSRIAATSTGHVRALKTARGNPTNFRAARQPPHARIAARMDEFHFVAAIEQPETPKTA